MSSRLPSPLQAKNAEDAVRALRLRAGGFSVDQIAEHLGQSVVQVRALIKHAVDELGLLKLEAAEELRGLEAARIDRMLVSIWDKAENGSLPHISVVLKLMERRAKLLALDMKPDDQQTGDKFVVIPAWAARPDQQVIEGEWRALEPADQAKVLQEAADAADLAAEAPERPQETIPGPPGT